MNKKILISLLIGTLIMSSLTACTNKPDQSTWDKEDNNNSVVKGGHVENALSQKDIPKRYQEIAGYLKNITGLQVPYLGGYDLNDQQIIVFAYDSDEAILWSGKDGTITTINVSEIPEEKRISSFADGKFNGIKTTFVAQEDNPMMAFILAIHEGYHFYGQEWTFNIQADPMIPRGTVYPEIPEARVFMNAADKSLRDYMDGKNSKGLAFASYFINQMKEKYKDDLMGNLNTALSEGSANFIENLYVAAAKNPELKDKAIELSKAAYENNKVNIRDNFHDKTSEYYHIASLPMYHLAMTGKIDQLDQMMSGKHGLEVIAQTTSPVKTSIPIDLKTSVSNYYNNANDKAKTLIRDFKSNANSHDYAKVLVPVNAFPGSMQFGEFINYKDGNDYRTVNTQTSANGQFAKGQLSLINQDTTNSQDYQYYVVYAKKKDIQADETFKIDTNTFKASGIKYQEKDGVYTLIN